MHWFTNTCSISGAVGNDVHSVDIISDSCAAGVLNVNKVSANNINSDKFRFQYTAFTFGTTHSDSLVATLECTIKICIKGRYIIFIDHFSYFSHQEYKFFIKNFKYLKIVYSSILKKKFWSSDRNKLWLYKSFYKLIIMYSISLVVVCLIWGKGIVIRIIQTTIKLILYKLSVCKMICSATIFCDRLIEKKRLSKLIWR